MYNRDDEHVNVIVLNFLYCSKYINMPNVFT